MLVEKNSLMLLIRNVFLLVTAIFILKNQMVKKDVLPIVRVKENFLLRKLIRMIKNVMILV